MEVSSIGDTEKSLGTGVRIVFGQKFPGQKGSVRLHCPDIVASYFVAKVQSEVFTHFH
jgi:hypothetical protein